MDARLERQIAALYLQQHSDAGIASMLAVPTDLVVDWRIAQGLQHVQNAISDPDLTRQWRLTVYHETNSDAEAAIRAGIVRRSFSLWRVREGLAPKYRNGETWKNRHDRILAEWRIGGTNREIAGRAGHGWKAVGRHLRTAGLQPAPVFLNRVQGVRTRDGDFWAAYCDSESNKEAAESLGIGEQAFARWVRRFGLPTRNQRQKFRDVLVTKARQGDPHAARACYFHGLNWEDSK